MDSNNNNSFASRSNVDLHGTSPSRNLSGLSNFSAMQSAITDSQSSYMSSVSLLFLGLLRK